MKFFIFNSVRAKNGSLCSREEYEKVVGSEMVRKIARDVAGCRDAEERQRMKKLLPVITWQASYKNGRRKNEEAVASGLYMVDFDHVKHVTALMKKAKKMRKELDIVYVGKSISGEGVRVVAECRKELKSIAQCQEWLSRQLGQECDAACKDLARASYVVPKEYEFYLDKGIFEREPKVVYSNDNDERYACGYDDGLARTKGVGAGAGANDDGGRYACGYDDDKAKGEVQRAYEGIPLAKIAEEYLMQTGGVPGKHSGKRHLRLRDLALKMRYITDFDARTIYENIPHCELPDEEVMHLCETACAAGSGGTIPEAMRKVLNLLKASCRTDDGEEEEIYSYEEPMPELPPVFSHFAKIAPTDFKSSVVLCLLPMLGTLGSKLRSHYITGKVESPTFHVTLEAGQASGKSFIEKVNDIVMKPMKDKDEESRRLEEEYHQEDEALRGSSTKKEREEYKKRKEERMVPIIREMGATASLTKVLKRMQAAQGLHLYAMAVELDTVTKAFRRGFSNLSDFLRCAFDNSEFAQDYASDSSWSGRVRVYYNLLYSGTPGAVAKFYNDSEDGTLSRTLFVTFPDQFGKKLPIWGEFDEGEAEEVRRLTQELYGISIQEDQVQEDHYMELGFLNAALEKWCEGQRMRSMSDPRHPDRTRGFFHRRCAEVGFRAGMLAHYLWGEQRGEANEQRVSDFAIWVAEKMLQQFVVRVNEEDSMKDNMNNGNLFNALPRSFTREQLEQELIKLGRKDRTANLLSRWKQSGKIHPYAKGAEEFKKREVSCSGCEME